MTEKPSKQDMGRLLNATIRLEECIKLVEDDDWWLHGVKFWSGEVVYLSESIRGKRD